MTDQHGMTPSLRLAHVDDMLDYGREHGTIPLATFESARNHLAAVVNEHNALLAEVEQPQGERDGDVRAERDMCTCGESKTVCELRTELDQLRAQLKIERNGVEADPDCEELVEIFADFIGQWDRSHEVITVGLPDHLPQLRIPHLRRAVVALQRLGRERDAARDAMNDDVRAVAQMLQVYGTWPGEPVSMTRLRARFADRIAALEARNAKAPIKRTPEEWCAEYEVDILDPDGWRGKNDPPWDEPITLADFLRRARQSTARNVPNVDWQRIARDAKAEG